MLVENDLLRICRSLSLILIFLLAFGIGITPAHAAVLTVDCNVANLVSAINTSSTNFEADTIELQSGCTYSLTSQLEIFGDEGALLTINGNGAIISGGDAVRVFSIDADANVVMNNLTITDGRATQGGGLYIWAATSVTLNNVTVSSNVAIGNPGGSSDGGGIYALTDLTLNNSSVVNNTAQPTGEEVTNGGGITSLGTTTLNQTTVSGNSAVNGGGILNFTPTLNVAVNINDSVISGNNATNGGAIYNWGITVVRRSSISGNTASGNGGGIFAFQGGIAAITNISNTTVSGNSAGSGSGIYMASGLLELTNATVTGNASSVGSAVHLSSDSFLRNSIIANSTSGSECTGTATGIQYTLIEDGSCGVGTGPAYANGNLSGDPSLGAAAIGSNGTSYFPLNAGSIAINVGNNALTAGFTSDQTGNPRIQDGTVDMGSFESSYASLTVQLALQSRPAAPNPAWVTGVHVQVRPSDGGSPVLSGDTTSNNQGQITLSGIPAGSYNVWIKGTHTLARVHAVTLAAGANNLTTDLLLEGDADDNNEIKVLDFSALSATFGTQMGNAVFDARADFNQDGLVTLPDFSLLASNFSLEGAP